MSIFVSVCMFVYLCLLVFFIIFQMLRSYGQFVLVHLGYGSRPRCRAQIQVFQQIFFYKKRFDYILESFYSKAFFLVNRSVPGSDPVRKHGSCEEQKKTGTCEEKTGSGSPAVENVERKKTEEKWMHSLHTQR